MSEQNAVHLASLDTYIKYAIQTSVCRQGFRNFLKKLLAQFISYLAFTLMGWVSWTLFIFVFLASFLALWWPNIWPKMGFPELFKKLLAQFISYLAFTLMGWVSWPLYIFVFLGSFSALCSGGQIFGRKMGFPELFERTFSSIHFISDIYAYGVSLLTPIHFQIPSLIFGPLVAKYLSENGVSGTFWKNYWLNSFHNSCTWHLCLWGKSLDPYTFSCS